jgi:hypothetical protein
MRAYEGREGNPGEIDGGVSRQSPPGKQTLTGQIPARDRDAMESPAGGNTEGAQAEGAAPGAPVDIAVQTVIPGAGAGGGGAATAASADAPAGGAAGTPQLPGAMPAPAPQPAPAPGGAPAPTPTVVPAPTMPGAADVAPVPAHTPAPATTAASEIEANNAVAPGGAPTVGTGANDCVPSTASAVVAWDVQDAGTNWRANVTSLTLAGRIRINPWPSAPSSMTVPNTPNPVDGGNINNTTGSNNHFQHAIDDMADYDHAGGGAGPHWHSTAASTAHEWAHWNQDYIGDSVTSAGGGNWAAINAAIDALTVSKTSAATAADARTQLQARVDAQIATWRAATIRRWNALISGTDTPGAGGRGYAAGVAVLAGHIAAVRAYKSSKGW